MQLKLGGKMSFDPNKVAADLATNLIKDVARGAISQTTKLSAKAKVEIESRISNVFRSYIEDLLDRNAKVRTMLHRNEPRSFSDIYVDAYLEKISENIERPRIPEVNFFKSISYNTKAIIKATAGAGKSLFMKKLIIQSCIDKKFVPIFIEVRKLNNLTNKDILTLIL